MASLVHVKVPWDAFDPNNMPPRTMWAVAHKTYTDEVSFSVYTSRAPALNDTKESYQPAKLYEYVNMQWVERTSTLGRVATFEHVACDLCGDRPQDALGTGYASVHYVWKRGSGGKILSPPRLFPACYSCVSTHGLR